MFFQVAQAIFINIEFLVLPSKSPEATGVCAALEMPFSSFANIKFVEAYGEEVQDCGDEKNVDYLNEVEDLKGVAPLMHD